MTDKTTELLKLEMSDNDVLRQKVGLLERQLAAAVEGLEWYGNTAFNPAIDPISKTESTQFEVHDLGKLARSTLTRIKEMA